ncbi:MAG: hypothetical protein KC416_11430, partial [Myxococcales bacterium]|nr:hypothetical protein [Myxococcales bacterium]
DLLLMAGPTWVAFTVTLEGAELRLHGTNKVHVTDPALRRSPDAKVRGVGAHLDEQEGIPSISWPAGPVAWSLDIECHRANDARCNDYDFIAQMAEQLVPATMGPEPSTQTPEEAQP